MGANAMVDSTTKLWSKSDRLKIVEAENEELKSQLRHLSNQLNLSNGEETIDWSTVFEHVLRRVNFLTDLTSFAEARRRRQEHFERQRHARDLGALEIQSSLGNLDSASRIAVAVSAEARPSQGTKRDRN
eukprot:TRINITY_DN7151_c0_g1_i5.p1 TRINITY_DN7151_c0_g1~~TRINITY_DN7151_c0_g1_i5.p1  ORF type:complete len:130 (-),score=3.40 TRINITY_DN7151_c0_g1_i5:17-406(-)